MRIIFTLTALLEIPDADCLPPAEDVQKAFKELFESEGIIVRSMEIMNYTQPVE